MSVSDSVRSYTREIVGSREIAAGTLKYTKFVRATTAQQWSSYVWQGSTMVRNSDETRCPAIHPESEIQCDFEIHEGDEHEFNNPVNWTACAGCHGGVEYHPECGGEVMVHEVDCPRLTDEERDD